MEPIMRKKVDIIREMKLLAMILALPVAALAVTVEPLPPSEFADTEVSTNIAFVVDRAIMTRIEFTVALDATPTNNVEVAIGTDGNGDGNLSVEESAYVFGYDCGKWFVRDQSKSKVEVEERNLSTCAPRIAPPSELASLGGYSLTSGETPLPRCCEPSVTEKRCLIVVASPA